MAVGATEATAAEGWGWENEMYRKAPGFTLIEMMIVVAIIALIASIVSLI